MENKKKVPHNNKALYHSLCEEFGKLINDEIAPEKAHAIANLAGKIQRSLVFELDRVKVFNSAGEKVSIDQDALKFRDIEKSFDN